MFHPIKLSYLVHQGFSRFHHFFVFFVGSQFTFCEFLSSRILTQDRYSEWKELELLPDKTCILYDVNAGPGFHPQRWNFGGPAREKGYLHVSARKIVFLIILSSLVKAQQNQSEKCPCYSVDSQKSLIWIHVLHPKS